MAGRPPTATLSRFRRRHRGQFARPRPSASGRGADRAGRASSGTSPTSSASPARSGLAERLCRATFADKVFFTNSGAEALECAIKTARRYHFANGHPERYHIITFDGAFHGRTLATIAAAGQPEISRRLRAQGRGLRPGCAVRRHQGRSRRRSRRRRRDPDRAGAGRGRHPPWSPTSSCAAARALRPARPAADLRRGAVRHRPHRQALRP